MTNTKFRKRALLSSVAMLLVAFIALGSATFAWFTSDPTADSTGIKMNTTTSTGLLAKAMTDSRGFSHHTALNYGDTSSFELQPASLDAAADVTVNKYYTATAGDEDNYAHSGAITANSFDASSAVVSTGIYAERIYLKTTGAESNTATVRSVNVALTPTSETMAAAVRVAVLDKTDKLIGIWGANGNTYAHDTSGTVNMTAAGTTYSVESGAKTVSLAVTGNATANWVTVIVYLDGQDATCKTTNVSNGTDLLNGFTVSFSL